MLNVNIMSSRKAGSGSTIMPRIMNISKGLARLRAFMLFNPAKMSARLTIELMNYDLFNYWTHVLSGVQFDGNRQIIRKLRNFTCMLPGFTGFLVAPKLVDIGQHLRYGVIKLVRISSPNSAWR